jgi:hypothetical protein
VTDVEKEEARARGATRGAWCLAHTEDKDGRPVLCAKRTHEGEHESLSGYRWMSASTSMVES